jgi:hypothetical protein
MIGDFQWREKIQIAPCSPDRPRTPIEHLRVQLAGTNRAPRAGVGAPPERHTVVIPLDAGGEGGGEVGSGICMGDPRQGDHVRRQDLTPPCGI